MFKSMNASIRHREYRARYDFEFIILYAHLVYPRDSSSYTFLPRDRRVAVVRNKFEEKLDVKIYPINIYTRGDTNLLINDFLFDSERARALNFFKIWIKLPREM